MYSIARFSGIQILVTEISRLFIIRLACSYLIRYSSTKLAVFFFFLMPRMKPRLFFQEVTATVVKELRHIYLLSVVFHYLYLSFFLPVHAWGRADFNHALKVRMRSLVNIVCCCFPCQGCINNGAQGARTPGGP